MEKDIQDILAELIATAGGTRKRKGIRAKARREERILIPIPSRVRQHTPSEPTGLSPHEQAFDWRTKRVERTNEQGEALHEVVVQMRVCGFGDSVPWHTLGSVEEVLGERGGEADMNFSWRHFNTGWCWTTKKEGTCYVCGRRVSVSVFDKIQLHDNRKLVECEGTGKPCGDIRVVNSSRDSDRGNLEHRRRREKNEGRSGLLVCQLSEKLGLRLRPESGWRMLSPNPVLHWSFGPGVTVATNGQEVILMDSASEYATSWTITAKQNIIGPVTGTEVDVKDWDYFLNKPIFRFPTSGGAAHVKRTGAKRTKTSRSAVSLALKMLTDLENSLA